MNPIEKAFEEAMKNPKLRKKLRVKAFLSLLLLVGFLGVVFITIGTMMASKNGTFLGMTHLDFLKLRARYGLFMMALITIHIIMNRGIMRKELGLLFG
ncbi:conserved protein of unknown function [Thermococcus nautili]|uniref:hypothetical protein n=1 Tax=Thermococcus nautili TaxID=195522 RepID=UPI002556C9C6|nr:hypothetical protein [Thermococcus nautili]CAI1493895.1 conserved protein of unknown function [Thermococcus nautili]